MDSKEGLEQVVEQVTSGAPAPAPAPAPTLAPVAAPENNMMAAGGKKKSNGMLYGMILLAILAIGGIGFGVWAMMDKNGQSETLNTQISVLKQQNNELQEKLNSATTTTIEIDTDAKAVNTAEYIYIGEWGLKIKIPEELSTIGYEFSEGSYGEYLTVAGAKTENSENLFKYTDSSKFLAGSLMKSNSEDGFYPYGTLVYTDSEQNKYYYEGPQADMGSTEEEINAWRAGADFIKEMLTNPENYSKI